MSAKKKNRPASPAPAKSPVASTPAVSPAPSMAAAATAAGPDAVAAPNPERQKLIATVTMIVVCVYVAALYLLALDQWFKWGIFGP
jgi:hypothetical protein